MTDTQPHISMLITSLLNAELYPHDVDALQLIETHISWVILTGPYAYKIKKPVNLGFLDFSTLSKRQHYCEEELRLNRRTAPSIYLDVVTITGTISAPRLAGEGDVIEYAVKMRQFQQSSQLDRVLSSQGLSVEQMDTFAEMVAEFHQKIAVADGNDSYGEPEHVWH